METLANCSEKWLDKCGTGPVIRTNQSLLCAGVVSISQPPQFSLISENPLEFTLTSTTTGGPPTTAFWIPPHGGLVDDTLQTLLDGVTGIVEHKLTVIIIGSFLGNYTFYTTNSRSGPPVSRSITVEGKNER